MKQPPMTNPGVQPLAWSVRMAESVMKRNPAHAVPKWEYEWGLTLKGILGVWRSTGDPRYFDYVKDNMDQFIKPDGVIRRYAPGEYNIDHINPGKVLFSLYAETGEERYRQAAYALRGQMRTQPRTQEGGFWHKQIYAHQMWLDGIFMVGPFLAEFGLTFDEPDLFDEVTHQIQLIDRHARDPRTNLLYHGWDESRSQRWADPETGHSPNFWGRAVGWYSMALADVLDFLPADHARRAAVLDCFQKTITGVAAVQDQASGVWFQILDQGGRPGNFLEASASCMFVYAIAKGIKHGYLPDSYTPVMQRAYQGILEQFITVDDADLVNLNQICRVAGLGGTPYRDGSYEYYINEPVVSNDLKGIGPFILAGVELASM